ncbi:MAG: hypothetical protein EHM20_16610 [Alphaproteobacteria bacterium]|nr:MAG: hypothetical protein EHM20_16610 [Alphaproteobacteria bacterium]
MQKAFAPNAKIDLEACYAAYNNKNVPKYVPPSIAHAIKEILPNATVHGFTGIGWNIRRTSMTGPKFSWRWVEVKN